MASRHLAFLTSQAAYIERQVYKIKYASIQYRQLVPVDMQADPWAGQITYFSQDGVGKMDFISNYATDFPTVDTEMTKHDVRIENLGISYTYNEAELRYAMRLGIPLSNDKAMIARRVYEEKLDDIVLNGVSQMGWDGLWNHSAVTSNTAAPHGTTHDARWFDPTTKAPIKGAVQIATDVNQAITGIWDDSKQVEMADTLLLSVEKFSYLATKAMSDSIPGVTIMDWVKANNVYTASTGRPLTIRVLRGLETQGGTAKTSAGMANDPLKSTDRMIAYRRSPDVLRFHVPMPLRFFPPQQRLLSYVVPGMTRIGGLEIRLPGAIRYVDGI